MAKAIFGLLGAMVGAGFASGREILHFFSRWGIFSWPLILGASVLMAALMRRSLEGRTGALAHFPGKALALPLLIATGGGMTAAAGELAALMIPIRHARTLGALLTLGGCLLCCEKPLGALSILGKVLIPTLAGTMILCVITAEKGGSATTVALSSLPLAVAQAAGYGGLNVTLATGVLADVGKGTSQREKTILAWATGAGFCLLLCLGNGALLPCAIQMESAALPTVLLLRRFGKAGYYLAGALLYLAVVSTLLSVLRGMTALLPGRRRAVWAGLLAAGASLLGFEGIVGAAYPALGLLSLFFLLAPP